jgi:hypothetical protein
VNGKYINGDAISAAVEEGLRRIRLRRRIAFGMLAGWLPFMAVASLMLRSEHILRYFALTYMGLVALTGIACGYSSCPRCTHLFFVSWWSNVFARRCMHCGVPLSGIPSDG